MSNSKGQVSPQNGQETTASQNEMQEKHISIQINLKDFATLSKKAEQEHTSVDTLILQSVNKLLR